MTYLVIGLACWHELLIVWGIGPIKTAHRLPFVQSLQLYGIDDRAAAVGFNPAMNYMTQPAQVQPGVMQSQMYGATSAPNPLMLVSDGNTSCSAKDNKHLLSRSSPWSCFTFAGMVNALA